MSAWNCCVPGCHINSASGVSCFNFPKDERMKMWLRALVPHSTKLPADAKVCELHFDPDMIRNAGDRKVVISSAVPRIKPYQPLLYEPNPPPRQVETSELGVYREPHCMVPSHLSVSPEEGMSPDDPLMHHDYNYSYQDRLDPLYSMLADINPASPLFTHDQGRWEMSHNNQGQPSQHTSDKAHWNDIQQHPYPTAHNIGEDEPSTSRRETKRPVGDESTVSMNIKVRKVATEWPSSSHLDNITDTDRAETGHQLQPQLTREQLEIELQRCSVQIDVLTERNLRLEDRLREIEQKSSYQVQQGSDGVVGQNVVDNSVDETGSEQEQRNERDKPWIGPMIDAIEARWDKTEGKLKAHEWKSIAESVRDEDGNKIAVDVLQRRWYYIKKCYAEYEQQRTGAVEKQVEKMKKYTGSLGHCPYGFRYYPKLKFLNTLNETDRGCVEGQGCQRIQSVFNDSLFDSDALSGDWCQNWLNIANHLEQLDEPMQIVALFEDTRLTFRGLAKEKAAVVQDIATCQAKFEGDPKNLSSQISRRRENLFWVDAKTLITLQTLLIYRLALQLIAGKSSATKMIGDLQQQIAVLAGNGRADDIIGNQSAGVRNKYGTVMASMPIDPSPISIITKLTQFSSNEIETICNSLLTSSVNVEGQIAADVRSVSMEQAAAKEIEMLDKYKKHIHLLYAMINVASKHQEEQDSNKKEEFRNEFINLHSILLEDDGFDANLYNDTDVANGRAANGPNVQQCNEQDINGTNPSAQNSLQSRIQDFDVSQFLN